MEYPTDWDVNTYYDETESQEHWSLRKQFMEVFKGKLPEDYLVAFSRALINIDFHSFVYSSPQATPKQTVLHLGQKRTTQEVLKDAKPDLSVSVSVVRDDLQLPETGNYAWKPFRLRISEETNLTDEEFYKTVRAITNKLTPQNAETLIKQIKDLTIDTKDRLQAVADIIFNKAVNNQKFSKGYALMCKHLAGIRVPMPAANREKNSGFVNFRKLLITKCQLEYECNSVDKKKRKVILKEIEKCTDEEKKRGLMASLARYDRSTRMKSVRTVRFIGELFKQGMLTVNIMMRCLNDLLKQKDAERLECLLTVVGKCLDKKGENLNQIFNKMEEIITDDHVKMSNMTRKDNRNSFGAGGRRRNRRKRPVQSGVPNKRMRYTPSQMDDSQFLSVWSRRAVGTEIKKEQPEPPTVTVTVNALPDTDGSTVVEAGGNKPNGKDDSVSHEPISTERTPKQPNDDLRSGTQHSLNEPSSSFRHSPAPTTAKLQSSLEAAPTTSTVQEEQQPPAILDEDDHLERQMKNILQEYLNECCTVDECDQDIKDSLSASALPKLVTYGCTDVLKQSKTARLKRGLFLSTLIKRGTLPLDDYCTGLGEVLAQVDDLIIDVPKVWDCLAELLLHPVCDQALPLKTFQACCKDLITKKQAGNLLNALFNLIITEKGSEFLQNIWQSSGLTINDFITSAPDASKFVEDNKFDFLVGENSELSYEQIHEQLIQLFSTEVSFNDVFKWINENVGERVKDKQFVRTLASAFFEKFIFKVVEEHCTVS